MKNNLRFIGAMSLAMICAAVSTTSCGKKKAAGGENKIQVKMYQGGYGRDWFDKIAENFVAYKAKKGITVEVELLQGDYGKLVGQAFKSEVENPKDNQFDLYILDAPEYTEVIADSKSILGKTSKEALLEPLDEVFNSKAIKNDGTEETKTIKERLYSGYAETLTYHRDVAQDTFDGKTFVAPWADAVTGIVCNTPLLSQFDLTKDDFITTDKFVASVKKIYNAEKGISPFTYSGLNAPGYWDYLYQTWLAQYMTPEGYKDYLMCRDPERKDGEEPETYIKENGYKVYEHEGIKKALEPMIEIQYTKYLVEGSHGHTYAQAQKNFADRKAVFMVNGDWLLKEMKSDVPETYENLKEAEMIKAPVLSSIGTKIGVNDDTLANIVKDIDSKTDVATIATKYSKTEDQINYVKKARTVHHGEGGNHLMCIPSYADAKELSKEFIRFMYSEDSCRVFNEQTYANLPFEYTPDSTKERTTFSKSLNELVNYDDVYMVCLKSDLNEIRSLSGMLAFNNVNWASANTYKSICTHNSVDEQPNPWTAEYIATEEAKTAKARWPEWMTSAGF